MSYITHKKTQKNQWVHFKFYEDLFRKGGSHRSHCGFINMKMNAVGHVS